MNYTHLEEALDENTPPERLRDLIDQSITAYDYYVYKAVARNPNTPTEILFEFLSGHAFYAEQVLENPVIPLLILEDPNFLRKVYQTSQYILHSVKLPLFFVQWLMDNLDKNALLNLAKNNHISKSILEKLAFNESVQIRQAVAENTNTPAQTLEVLAKDKCQEVRLSLTQYNYHNCSTNILEKLAQDKDDEVRTVAMHKLNLLKNSF